MKEQRNCEVCGCNQLTPVLDLGSHPLCDDLVPVGDERVCREYPIEILICETCLTAHQRYQVVKEDLFPKEYHYRSRFTLDVLNGMKNLVDECDKICGGISGKKVLDIGCNDGSLLDFFKEKGALTSGIEPTGAADDARGRGHFLVNGYFDEDAVSAVLENAGSPDIITFTNVFAHIDDLNGMLDLVRKVKNQNTKLIIENHYLKSIIDSNQFDTFYHEHPRTYSLTSFAYIAEKLGMVVESHSFPSRYGGNIRVILGERTKEASDGISLIGLNEEKLLAPLSEMQSNVGKWIEKKSEILAACVADNGPLVAKAFPGRAAILCKLLNLDHDQIRCVHEKPGSAKLGHYLPGTRIPILSDEELFAAEEQPKVILNFAWHIHDEISKYLVDKGLQSRILSIVEKDDFL